ncbi:chorismate-binding protein [Helicobacter burdigaliensis]|uniref:chorismate-binding protein n=1 Tax=Helicobacter burdigaliensis TaxID=2315334 RepID=UPI000EF642E6|nr:chorismate-binding protein [Helicobacter burdigaliensis]
MFDFLNSNSPHNPHKASLYVEKIPASKLTPLLVCEVLNACVLLESAFLKSGKGRFSILILEEAFRIVKQKQEYSLIFQKNGEKKTLSLNPKMFNNSSSMKFLDYLKAFREFAPSTKDSKLPLDVPLPLGGVGYLGYEFFSEIEEIDLEKKSLYEAYENAFIFGRDFVVFDHFYESLYAISITYSFETSSFDVKQRAKELIDSLMNLKIPQSSPKKIESKILSPNKEEYFTNIVSTLKNEIYKGNLLQCVPSVSMQIQSNLTPLQAYTNLRISNPSPYMFYYNFGHFHIIGSSPEVLIKLKNEEDGTATLTLRPIAGTRPRGETQLQDLKFEEELKNDIKENAEHLMLLDLGRNDIGKVAIGGSVKVSEEKVIEKYSRVMHLVSEVQGKMDLKMHSQEEAILASFPAGTVSGAPKIQAIKTIYELEEHKRCIYAGAIGYFTKECDINLAIAIRSAVYQNGIYYLQAGAGVVYDSNPLSEYLETQNKMLSLKEAIMGEKQ